MIIIHSTDSSSPIIYITLDLCYLQFSVDVQLTPLQLALLLSTIIYYLLLLLAKYTLLPKLLF